MATDKKISYINQDGYKNYIKNSDSITIPKKFKARKNATSTHLAYITKAEAKQLKKQNKSTPHKGPKGIPSYDDYDATGGGYGRATSGQQMSAMESSGGQTERNRADARALGYTPQEVADIRGGAEQAAAMGQRGSGIGGLLGGLGRGLLSIFGGIPGKIMSGIMTAKNWAQKKGTGVLEGVKEFGEHDDLMSYLNRNKVQAIQPIKTIDIRDKFDRRGNVMQDNLTTNMGVNNQNVPSDEELLNFQPYKEGGRIGYRTAGPVLGDDEGSENIFEFMQDQGIPSGEMVSNEWNDRLLEQLYNKFIDQGFSPADAEKMAMDEFELMSQGPEQTQGIASLV